MRYDAGIHLSEENDTMKKGRIIFGILFLIAAAVLALLGTKARSMFYGIMDAPYSEYGKYWTYMKAYYIAAAVSCVIGIVCLIWGKHK